jgi:microcystin-dependent protein
MAEPFLSEIRLMSFNFAPKGWALCNGQLLPINQNQPLFALLGTTYGGNGQTNFALPDLRGKAPLHVGNGHTLGETGGQTAHTITQSEMPTHLHVAQASSANGDVEVPTSATLARSDSLVYANASNVVALHPQTVSSIGGSQPHNNMMPYSVISFCIALQGIFPSPN